MAKSTKILRIFIFSVAISYLLSMTILVLKNYIINYPPDSDYILKNESLMGGDFIAFYTGGKLARLDRPNLYNFKIQRQIRKEILKNYISPIKGELPFVYPPLVASFFSLFAFLKFDHAFYLWTFLSILISLSSLFILSYYIGILTFRSFFLILLSIFGFIPYSLDCLAGGQLSTFAIFIFSFLFILIREKKFFCAGLLLSLGYYKPPLFLFFSIIAIFFLGKRFLFGCITGAFLLTVFSIWYTGFSGFLNYLSIASKYTYGQELMQGVKLPPELGMGIFAIITTIAPSSDIAIFLFLLIFMILLYVCFKIFINQRASNQNFDLVYAFLLISSIGLSLQIINYDLNILLPAFLLLYKKFGNIGKYKFIILLLVCTFYFEWIFRKIEIFGFTINLSSILFFLLINFLCLSLLASRKQNLNLIIPNL